MIEGQEGVTWEDWVALASACEEHGVEALFRSDHYVSTFDESRPVLDAWTTIAGLAATTTSLELGTRFEAVRGKATGDLLTVDTTRWVPRLGASYDVMGDGRTTLQATYGHYSGKYSESQTRTLQRVTIEDAALAERIFTELMGDKVEPRKAFIERHAREVRFLDV